MATTLDSTTKVNLGIFGLLLGTCVGGAWWASNIDYRVSNMEESGNKQVAILERIETKIGDAARLSTDNAKAIAVNGTRHDALASLFSALERRVTDLERRLTVLEK